jgi:hypothetical protein
MSEPTRSLYCARCGAELPPGSLKYLVTIHVTADFDGRLPEEGGMEDLEAFMKQLDSPQTAELEKDVYQSQGWLVCPGCKAAFLANPLGGRPNAGGEGGKVH